MALLDGSLFFQEDNLLRPVLVGPIGYLFVILCFKVLGGGTLAQPSVIALVTQVTLGTILASMFVEEVNLSLGLLAAATLMLINCVTSLASAYSPTFASLLRDRPVLLVLNGQLLQDMMIRSRICPEDIYSTLRKNGIHDLRNVHAVVLEITGTMSILFHPNNTIDPFYRAATCQDVQGYPVGVGASPHSPHHVP